MTAEDNSPPSLSWTALTLNLRVPFRLSYGVTETRRSFWVRLAGDEGWGEAAIPPYYGVSDESMVVAWEAAARRAVPLPDDPSQITGWIGPDDPAPARCALDLALHDRLARRSGVPIWQLLGLPRPPAFATCFTIAIDEPFEMARRAGAVRQYETLKIKLGSEDDFARLKAIREARPDARLRVDANAGWGRAEAVDLVRRLEPLGIELVEQPVAREDIEGLGYVQARTSIPIVADESCQTLADVEAIGAAGVAGINLKLQKAGGLGPGAAMARRAREMGMRVMLGCMIETSIGATAMAHLAGLADWIDLDSPLLIANDPFDGIRYDDRGGIHLPDRPGIGAIRRE
jgi:L-alanine-DL-glutamate epimerase-like enolase superfamily enzyme